MHPHARVVRALWDSLWRQRDLDAARELVHPDAEFEGSDSEAPYRGHYTGYDSLTTASAALLDAWDEWDPRFEEVIEVDPETVLIVTHIRARGKGSGVEVEARGASVWTVRDGKVAAARLFQSKEEAFRTLGVADAR